MPLSSLALLAAGLAPLAAGHGVLTRPMARQKLLNVGLTHPGLGMCDLSEGNAQNMNGCQGAGGVNNVVSACHWECGGGDISSTAPDCTACKEAEAQKYRDAGRVNPAPMLGPCGDLYDRQAFSTNFSSGACDALPGSGSCIDKALAKTFSEVSLDGDRYFDVEVEVTAYHSGWFEFRLCREGGRGRNDQGVTQECFNQEVLQFDADHAKRLYGSLMKADVDDPTDYEGTGSEVRCDGAGADWKLQQVDVWAPEGSCCNKGGSCGSTGAGQRVRWTLPETGSTSYDIRLQMPAGVTCTQEAPCTLQWLYMTGNSQSSYPEAFKNCADFKIAGSPAPSPTPQTAQTTDSASTTASQAQTTAPTPQPRPTPTPEPSAASTTGSPASTTRKNEGCVDLLGNKCSACLANNNVCYGQDKEWCDLYPQYKWCGASLAQSSGAKIRKHEFLGNSLLQASTSVKAAREELEEL